MSSNNFFFDLFSGWDDNACHPDAPRGGGGPGYFRQSTLLNECFYLHPYSPVGKMHPPLVCNFPYAPIQQKPNPTKCACNRSITLLELCAIFSKQKKSICEKYLPLLNDTFVKYNINSCLRKAHFLAQVGHESGELHYTAEQLKKGVLESSVYDGYKGRGLIQLTWKKNYVDYGNKTKHDFLGDHKKDLEEPKWATDSAGWYWTSENANLNLLADKNDLLAITAHVNGAFNGFEDRKNQLLAAFEHLKVKTCKTVGIGNATYLPFTSSQIYDNLLFAFAWGCWNDDKTNKKGVNKSITERKAGYQRFLDKFNALPAAQQDKFTKDKRKHYGYEYKEMLNLAKEGIK